MPNNNFTIDFEPPSLVPGVTNLLNVFKSNREQARLDEAAKREVERLKNDADRVRNEERRLSAEEFRRSRDYEESKAEKLRAAYLSSIEYDKRGDHGTAKSIRMQHGIAEDPIMSEPQVFTPAQALAQAPKPEQGPVSFDAPSTQSQAPVTPLSVFRGTQTGTTVPEEQPQAAAVPPPDVTNEPAPSAVNDLMPMTVDPTPTGAKRFYGPSGQLIGEFDPAQERAFREERAGRVTQELGPAGAELAAIGRLLAMGDIDPKALGPYLANATARETAQHKDTAREDQQAFDALQNKLYKNEPLTVADRKELARISAAARMQSAGAGPTPMAVSDLVRMKEEGASDSDIAAAAANAKLNPKVWQPAVQNAVKNAATAEKANEKRAALEVTDSTGRVLGTAHNAQQANTLKKQTDQFAQAKIRLEELIADIERTGSRVLTPEDIQQRLSKAESVNAAMRVYNGLSATDGSQKLESRITSAIGTPGHGFLMGANVDIIKRILHEAESQHNTRVKTALRSGGGKPLSGALGGKPATGGGAAPAGPDSFTRPNGQVVHRQPDGTYE